MITIHLWALNVLKVLAVAGVYYFFQSKMRGITIDNQRGRIDSQVKWIRAQANIINDYKRQLQHVTKGMTAFFPDKAKAISEEHPEGWDA